jgi:hypothetical protein
MKKKSYIIEFAGLAGSGKTLTKNLLIEKLKEDTDILIFSNNYKISISDIIKWQSIVILYNSLRFIFTTKQKTLYYFLKGLINWFKIQLFYSIIRNKGGLLVIDEGVFQKFRGIRRNSIRNELKVNDVESRFIERIYFPDLVVLIRVSSEDIIERRKKRDGIILEDMKEAIERVNLTKADIASLNNLVCFELNNSSDIPRSGNEDGLNNLISIIKKGSGFFEEIKIKTHLSNYSST